MTATQARVALKAAAPLLLGAVLSALVCYPFAGGRLLLLDFVSGPHQPILPAEAFGLNGALTGGVPFALGCSLLDHVLGEAERLAEIINAGSLLDPLVRQSAIAS